MNTLYIFGCSYSATYNDGLINDIFLKKYYKFRGYNFPKTWSELLSEKLKLNLVNSAIWGTNNYNIFENFCKEVYNIKKNDIVIIGWTNVNRFRLYSKKFDYLYSINSWTKNENNLFEQISQRTLDEILLNRNNDLWLFEIYNWMNIINKLSELIEFKLYYWSYCKEFSEFSVDFDIEDITLETKGEIINGHFGENGHMILCDYFKNKFYDNN